jgi:hypothetical protein
MTTVESTDAQGSAGSNATIEPRYIIDVPTAGILSHGNLAFDAEIFQPGGILLGVSIGAFNRLTLGVSYGGSDIIGSNAPNWNPIPGMTVRLRMLDETVVVPAIALGFESQGKGAYVEQLSRFTTKSMGVYAVASKNYRLLGFASLHGGVNYSFERADGNRDPNLFFGIDKTLGPFASIVAEYNVALNDISQNALGRGRGYLNLGARVSVGSGLTLGVALKDLLQNQHNTESTSYRTLSLEYVWPL